MSSGATVNFRVNGGELTSFFAKVKNDSKSLSNDLIENAKKETNASTNQLKLIQDQIIALEKRNRLAAQISSIVGIQNANERLKNIPNRQATIANLVSRNESDYRNNLIDDKTYKDKDKRLGDLWDRTQPKNIGNEYKQYLAAQSQQTREAQLQTKFLRENVQAVKDGAKDNVKAVKDGDKNIEDVLESAKTPQEKLAASLAKEELEGKKPKSDSEIGKLIGGALGVATISSIIGQFGKLTQTKNGFDSVGAGEQSIGTLLGAGLGLIAGIIVAGVTDGVASTLIPAFVSGGAVMGGEAGGVIGGVDQKRINAVFGYLEAQNSYMATTGGNAESTGLLDRSDYGLSRIDALTSSREYARLAGSSRNAKQLAEESYFATKGYGVDQSTSNSLIENQRSTNRDDIQLGNIIGGVLEKGKNTFFRNGDTSFLNEFLGKYSTLTKELLKSTNTVASGTTFDILSKFNALGGQFDIRDPRAMGLYSNIQSALANPSNDYEKAGDFIALRQANPEMELIDILKEQSKGLGSDGYVQGVLKQLRDQGGDRSQQILNIASRFHLGNNYSAAESIYNSQDDLINGKMSMKDIGVKTDLSNKAKEFTTPEQQNTALLTNKLTSDFSTAAGTMVKVFYEAMTDAFAGMQMNVDSRGKGYIIFDSQKATTAKKERVSENFRNPGNLFGLIK